MSVGSGWIRAWLMLRVLKRARCPNPSWRRASGGFGGGWAGQFGVFVRVDHGEVVLVAGKSLSALDLCEPAGSLFVAAHGHSSPRPLGTDRAHKAARRAGRSACRTRVKGAELITRPARSTLASWPSVVAARRAATVRLVGRTQNSPYGAALRGGRVIRAVRAKSIMRSCRDASIGGTPTCASDVRRHWCEDRDLWRRPAGNTYPGYVVLRMCR